MNCEESKNLITISVYGKLTPSEKEQLEKHLRECSSCARIFEKSEKLSNLFDEEEDIHLPDKEKSWQIVSAKAVKRKGGWLERLVPIKPVFQYSAAILLLVVGFAAGYFIHSGWQRGGEIAQLRQEVLQIRQIAAASLLRQESLNRRLGDIGMNSLSVQPEEGPWGSIVRILRGETEVNLYPVSIDDPSLFPGSPAVRQDFIQSLSEQTSPLVEVALALVRHIEQLKLR
ncbi:MAG: zf-HC2 domain-containing protein [Candidatus Aminicenantes bacterium]|nr:MAG: zf-HC2 domain-containing protein [Candidatus Aminicenantes bacterium]